MTRTRYCPFCLKDTQQEVLQNITASNSICYGWRCACDRWVPKKGGGQWIAKEELIKAGVVLDDLGFIMRDGPRCVRCGQRGAEEHHWLPVSTVGRQEADLWPKDFLCKPCHDQWHDILKANGLILKPNNPYSTET